MEISECTSNVSSFAREIPKNLIVNEQFEFLNQ